MDSAVGSHRQATFILLKSTRQLHYADDLGVHARPRTVTAHLPLHDTFL